MHTVTVAPNGGDYLGAMTAVVSTDTENFGNQHAGEIDWTFQVDDSAIDSLAQGQVLTQSYTVTVTDNNGASDSEVVTVTITGTNDAPVVQADDNGSDALVEQGSDVVGDAMASGNVLNNDTDVDAIDVLSVASVNGSSSDVGAAVTGTYGSIVLNSDGGWVYTLDNDNTATDALADGETATEAFTYAVSDGNGGTATSTLTLTISGSNDTPPIETVADDFYVAQNGASVFNPLANDVAAEGSTLTLATINGETAVAGSEVLTNAGGSLLVNANGTVIYNAPDGYIGADSFTYTVSDGTSQSAEQVASITVTETNLAPTVSATNSAGFTEDIDGASMSLQDSGTISFDDANTDDIVDISFKSNSDISWNGDIVDAALAAKLVAGFSTGVLDADAPGSTPWTYNAAGLDLDFLSTGEAITWSYTVTATDRLGATSQTVVDFSITGTDDAESGLVISSVNVGENLPGVPVGTLSVLDKDENDEYTYSIVSGDDGALFTISGDQLRVGTEGLDFETSPSRTVTVRATGDNGQVQEATITVSVFDAEEITLTTVIDVINPSDSNIQLAGNATTLNSFDLLNGGDGYDSLVLYGGGTYDLNTIDEYEGFESLVAINLTTSAVNLTLKEGSSTDVTLVANGATTVTAAGATQIGSLVGGDSRDTVNLSDTASIGSFDAGSGSGIRLNMRGDSTVGEVSAEYAYEHQFYLYDNASVTGTMTLEGYNGRGYMYDSSTIETVDFGDRYGNQMRMYGSSSVTTLDLGSGGGNRAYLYDTSSAENIILGGTDYNSDNTLYVYSDTGWNGISTLSGGMRSDTVYVYGTDGTYDTTETAINGVERLYFFGANAVRRHIKWDIRAA
jgi:VCBS repeat-containing protein